MKLKTRKSRGALVAIALALTQFSQTSAAQADVNTIQVTLAAAEPSSYNHATGGGAWNEGKEKINIRKSLEAEDFKCDDIVTYLTDISVPNTTDLKNYGSMTLDLHYSISMDTTGQSGVALGEPVATLVNTNDSANSNNGNSTATIVGTSQTGAMFSKGAELLKTVRLTGVEAGERIIVRLDTKISCQGGTYPTGNLQVKFRDASMVFSNGSTAVNPPVALNSGEQTISLKNVQNLGKPALAISKTVTTENGSCPGQESITIEPRYKVKYCYAVSNPSGTGLTLGAPLYNVSTIADDHGPYPDFTVALTSGLTDIDNDGQKDDLAIGATAYGEYVTGFGGTTDETVVNTATVTGWTLPTGGTMLSASDTATVVIDPPVLALTINKLTNGVDGAQIVVGSPVNWTYLLTNTSDRALSNVHVTDSKGVTVTCPSSTLAMGASMTCTASGVAIDGAYSNIGTAYGTWDTTEVTASDESSYTGVMPKIDIQKTPDSQLVIEGQKATFTITVTNNGPVALTGVVVTDPLSTDCSKSIGNLAAGDHVTYTCQSDLIAANLQNVASVIGYYGTFPATASDSAEVTVDYLPNIAVTKSADPASVVETGANVTFTFNVKNNGKDAFTLTSLVDTVFGDLNGQGTCSVPQTIAVGETYSCSIVKLISSDTLTAHHDVVTATGHDPEGNPGSGSGDATVTFTDVLPLIGITKSANPTLVPESGGDVTFTFVVTNKTAEVLFLKSLVDDKFGDLNGQGTCSLPQTLAGNGSYTCEVTKHLGDWTLNAFKNTVTGSGADNEGNQVSDSASATVNFSDVLPDIAVTKSANPLSVPESGGDVTFTFVVNNKTGDLLTLNSLIDDKFGDLNGQGSCILPQTLAGNASYTCTVTKHLGDWTLTEFKNTVTATGHDDEGNPATAQASASVTFSDVLPSITVTKSADPISVPESGGPVAFTFVISNKTGEPFMLTSLLDDKFGNLAGLGNCLLPQTIAGNGSYTCTVTKTVGDWTLTPFVNTITASGHDDEGNPASAQASATVNFTDILPKIGVTKTANPISMPESGGLATFTFVIENYTDEAVILDSLVDDKFGDLSGQGTCVLPQLIAGKGSYTCTVAKQVGDWTINPFVNTVTATGHDNENNPVSEKASAQVTFTDILPAIDVTKTVTPTIIKAEGDWVDYTILITNTGGEAVVLTSLVDDKVPLSAECTALIGQTIPIAGSLQCKIHVFMKIPKDSSLSNTATAIAKDNEGNAATDIGSATLNARWNGRTPGYWKNHASAWTSGYTPKQFVNQVFIIPSSLLTNGVLDLGGAKGNDTLMDALAYKGGSKLRGAAQILLRASVAALLNEAYYGANYPAETSTSALIAHVNSVLATEDRDTYLALASFYDKWNNGLETPLP